MQAKIKIILKNKLFLYLTTRYFTYFIQFVTSIIIAAKLGPYYFGIWSFFLLIINYFNITNFGISNSISILLVQQKKNKEYCQNLVKTSLALCGLLVLLTIVVAIVYSYGNFSFAEKYAVGYYFYIICLIAAISYFNNLLMNIYRVNNSLFEVGFFQSIIPLLVFISIFLAKGNKLLIILLIAYIIGHVISLFVFLRGNKLPRNGKVRVQEAKAIINKGLYLFVYNFCFYMILVALRTIISYYYSVEEFAYFTFAYTLVHAIMLFLDAVTFVMFPKIIDKLASGNNFETKQRIKKIRDTYVVLAHGLVYMAMIVLPLFLQLFPKYSSSSKSIYYIALTVLLYASAFGYNSLLMARNKERLLMSISIVSLSLNIILALLFVNVLHLEYYYIILSTMVAYLTYGVLCTYFGARLIGENNKFFYHLLEYFPINLMIPWWLSLALAILKYDNLHALPMLVFLVLNIKRLKGLVSTFKHLAINSSAINI